MKHLDNIFAYVDGSFNPTTNTYGYGVYLYIYGTEYEFNGSGNNEDMVSMRNVAGEILGATKVIEEALKLGIKNLTIYYDYTGIEKWATGEWKCNKLGTKRYYEYVQSVKEKIKLKFVKVKAHSGNVFNDRADKLAKDAVFPPKIPTSS